MKIQTFFAVSILIFSTLAAHADTNDNISKANFRNAAAMDLAQGLGKKQIVCGDRFSLKVDRLSNASTTLEFNSTDVYAPDAQISMSHDFYIVSAEFDPPDTTALLIPRVTDIDKKGYEVPVFSKETEFDITITLFTNHTDASMGTDKVHCVIK